MRATQSRSSSEFEASCFDGKYITGDVTADYLSQLAEERDDRAARAMSTPRRAGIGRGERLNGQRVGETNAAWGRVFLRRDAVASAAATM